MRRLLLCSVLVAGSPAFAQDAPAPAPAPNAPKTEGEYGGVQPGQAKKAEPSKKPRKPPKGTLSWIGFEAKEGGAQLFLQSAAPFEISQRVDKGVLIISLSGVKRLGPNTWRFLDTRFFETTLSRVTARKKGRGIEVRVAFKDKKDAAEGAVRTATEADGLYYAYVTFTGTAPPPSSPGTGAAPAPAAPPQDLEK